MSLHKNYGFCYNSCISYKVKREIKMISIDSMKDEIIERLLPLEPEKIILFGSYAYGKPNVESDIDLFLVMKETKDHIEAKALFSLRDLMKKYKIGFDVLAESRQFIAKRVDPFYKIDIMEKGKLLYGK